MNFEEGDEVQGLYGTVYTYRAGRWTAPHGTVISDATAEWLENQHLRSLMGAIYLPAPRRRREWSSAGLDTSGRL